jgi:hypothetical protein
MDEAAVLSAVESSAVDSDAALGRAAPGERDGHAADGVFRVRVLMCFVSSTGSLDISRFFALGAPHNSP